MAHENPKPAGFALRAEWPLGFSLLTVGAFFIWGPAILSRVAQPIWLVATLVWLLAVILLSAFGVPSSDTPNASRSSSASRWAR